MSPLRAGPAALLCVLLAWPAAGAEAEAKAETQRPAAAETPRYVGVPGTRVELPLPEGFALAETFAGIVHDETGASVLVSELPAPIHSMRASLTRKRLEAGGLVVHALRKLDLAGTDATLVEASQLVAGVPYRKWLLVFGDDERTLSLVASVEARHGEALGGVLERSLRSARWDPDAEIDPFLGLSFRVHPTEALVLSERVASMLFLTKPHDAGPIQVGDPLFIVGTTPRPDDLSDLPAFARENVVGIEEVRDVAFVSERALEIDGLPAFETVADAVDRETGDALVVYQALALAGEDQVVLMQGIVGAPQAPRYLPEFRTVAKSFERR